MIRFGGGGGGGRGAGGGGGNLTRLLEGDIQQTHLPRTLIFFSDEENQKNGWTGGGAIR